MEIALVLQELLRRRRALAVGAVIAAIVAILSVYRTSGFGLAARQLQHSSATTQVLVDTPSSALGNVSQPFEPLQARATVYANFLASQSMLKLIGLHAGVAGDRLYAAGPVDALVPRVVEEPTAVQRNVEITGEEDPYRLNFNDDPNLPTIGIYAQAPKTPEAIRLADSAAWALKQYVAETQAQNNVPPHSRVVIRQLGQAQGGVSNGGISKALAVIAFVGTFLVWCGILIVSGRFRESWRAAAGLHRAGLTPSEEPELAVNGPRRPAAANNHGAQSPKSRGVGGRGSRGSAKGSGAPARSGRP